MIPITNQTFLKPLVLSDHPLLWQLMQSIYPPAYAHFWKDDCSWYLKEQYGIDNFKKELEESESSYYVVHLNPSSSLDSNDSPIGILRLRPKILYPPLPNYKAFKVHRLYLHPQTQGKSIGRHLMNYAAQRALKEGHQLIWLDAMDTHTQAQSFYKSLGYERTDSQQLPFKLLHDEHRKMWYMHKML